MIYRALIRDNATGQEVWYTGEWTDGDPYDTSLVYCWQDGNYGCDCNRQDFFEEAGGTERPDDLPCGETVFTVPYLMDASGEKYLVDDEALREV